MQHVYCKPAHKSAPTITTSTSSVAIHQAPANSTAYEGSPSLQTHGSAPASAARTAPAQGGKYNVEVGNTTQHGVVTEDDYVAGEAGAKKGAKPRGKV